MEYLIILLVLIVTLKIVWIIRDYRLLKKVTKLSRGTRTERNLVVKLLKYGFPSTHIYHDLYLKKLNGQYSQIDLVAVTSVGILVFEVKEYSGWIFGSGYQSHWTQILAYGKSKYRFYNPIKQNNSHLYDLKKALQHEHVPYYSIVVFYGDCEFKEINYVPDGTFIVKSERIGKVIQNIFNQNDPIQYHNEKYIFDILNEAALNGDNKQIKIKHIENINVMLGRNRIFD
ncbi:nuclease-related domain-containing protein [Flavobacterium filum]|uniref:nuclease-related domain-containing protein n=1 Tax=Flavobacterium filum TaxID=370974 RepID=UPI0004158E25|nr:nuclease-related domain-containing protein [Flavobacterium filum]